MIYKQKKYILKALKDQAQKAYKEYVKKYGPYDLKQYPFVIPGSTSYGDLCINYDSGEYRLFSEYRSIDTVIKWSDLN